MLRKSISVFVILVGCALAQGATVLVEDFESYNTTGDLAGSVDGYDGVAAPNGSLILETDVNNVYKGSKSLRVDYDLSPGIHGFIDLNFAAQDWTVGQYLSFWVKGAVGNSAEFYWILTVDDGAQTKNYLNAGYLGTSILTNESGWQQVVIDMSGDPRYPANFTSVSQLQVNIQWGSGGTGTVYIDDIKITNTFPAGPSPIIDNFESYNTTADLSPGIIGYSGVALPNGSLALETDVNNVYEGSKSLRVDYDLSSGIHGIIDIWFGQQDWTQSPYLSFMVKGMITNSAEFYWVLTVDDGAQTKNYLYAGNYLTTTESGWQQVIIDMTSDPRYPVHFADVNQVQLIIQWGSGGTGTVWFDDIRMLTGLPGSAGFPIDGDLDSDGDVDMNDMAGFSLDWLVDEVNGPVAQVGLEDFESYSSTSALLLNWEVDFFAPGNSTLTLINASGDAYEGSNAMRWVYDVNDEVSGNDQWTEIEKVLSSPLDLSQYDQMRLRIKRHSGNSQENILYVKFLDNWAITGESWIRYNEGSTYYPVGEWDEWVIDLHALEAWKNGYSQLSELTSIDQVMLGCASSALAGARGMGTIDIDEIVLIQRPCNGYPAGDINLDCKEDFTDYVIMAENWLVGT